MKIENCSFITGTEWSTPDSWTIFTKPKKMGKNGDRRHKDNIGINQYRRKTDTRMPPEELTSRVKILKTNDASFENCLSALAKRVDALERRKSLWQLLFGWMK